MGRMAKLRLSLFQVSRQQKNGSHNSTSIGTTRKKGEGGEEEQETEHTETDQTGTTQGKR